MEVTLNLDHVENVLYWMWAIQRPQIAQLWFVGAPRLHPSAILIVPWLVFAGIALRIGAARRSGLVATLAVAVAIMAVLAAGNYLALLVNAETRSLMIIERVKWPFAILMLVPILYLGWRCVQALSMRQAARLAALAAVAAVCVAAVEGSKSLILQGRIMVGAIERNFVINQLLRERARGKNLHWIAVIYPSRSPYPRQINDEFFMLTAQNAASLSGMMIVLAKEIGAGAAHFSYAPANQPVAIEKIVADAVAQNGAVVDYREYPPQL
jgi:hypothetical protein